MRNRPKWLDDERYIRMAGVLLLISPFTNFFVSIAAASSSPNSLTSAQLWTAFVNVSALAWIMRVLKVTVGILMVRGKSSAWIPVLAILGFTIAYNLMTFKRDYALSPTQAVLSLITNIVFFLIVFRAEFRMTQEINSKIKAARAQRTQVVTAPPKPLELNLAPKQVKPKAAPGLATVTKMPKKKPVGVITITKGMLVAFEGHGEFARVIFCTTDELWLESTKTPPDNLKDRSIVLDSTKPKGSIRLRYDRTQNDSVLIFKVMS